MKKYLFAAAVASTLLLGLSAQAAPLSPGGDAVQNQVTSGVQKVWHCRYWSGGWGCGWGWHNRWRSHWRWGSRWGWHNRWRSHWRWGSYRRWWR